MAFRYCKYITRGLIRVEPNALFVFGDNIKGAGFGGQAAQMRGEPNAVGIPTKWFPSGNESAYFKDSDFHAVVGNIDKAFGRLFMHAIGGGDIVWPMDGIGTGLAELPQRAPKIWNYIEAGRLGLERLAADSSLPLRREPVGPRATPAPE